MCFGQTSLLPELGHVKMPNYFTVTADMTSATWNTVASHEIITVTGLVHVHIIPLITGPITSSGGGATLVLGDETTSNSIITSTDAEALTTNEFWMDSTTTRTVVNDVDLGQAGFIVNGKDIGYTIGVEALTGGSIKFYVWWESLDGGSCVAGVGSSL